jgi:hypothetical protein
MTTRTSYYPWHTDTWRTLTRPAYRVLDAIVRTPPSSADNGTSESFTARWAAARLAVDGDESALWQAIAELHDAGVLASGSRSNPVLRPHRSAGRVLRLKQYNEWRIEPHPWTLEPYVEWNTHRSSNLPTLRRR